MKIYFVTNDRWYSRLTRYLSGDKVTHIGVCFNFHNSMFVLDITKPYGSLYDYDYWFYEKYKDVSNIYIPLSEEEELELFESIKKYSILKKYDWNAYYYAMIVGIFHKIIPFKLPEKNIFSEKNKALCTSILEPLKDFFLRYNIDLTNIDFKAKTPGMLETIIRNGLMEYEEIRKQLFEKVNEVRKIHNAQEVRTDIKLEKAAKAHSEDMWRNGYCDHVSGDGSTFIDRVRRTGRLNDPSGEIICKGPGGKNCVNAVIDGWLNSPGHRNILLDPNQKYLGIGFNLKTEAIKGNYWVIVFAYK